MRRLSVVMLESTPASTPAERRPPRALYAKERVGFDVARDPAVDGHHIASDRMSVGKR